MNNLKVKIETYDDLTEEEKDSASNNGGGKEYSSYLRVTYFDKTISLVSDGMEPEDACFSRSLGWIKGAIERAYELGRDDERNSI